MKDLIGNVVFVEFYGKGYYSGSSESHSAFVTKEFFEENKETFENYTPYFHELDGKHSEIEGDVNINLCNTEERLREAIKKVCEKDDDWMIWESCLDGVDGVEEQVEFSKNITSKITSKTVTTYMIDGVEV